MIDLENLDDKTPLEIFNESVQKIKHINPKWTYKELSDPGITLIELFSWLKADQHKYLNRVSNVLKVKILKLLGLSLDKRRGSKTLLHISNLKKSLVVPKGTKWKSNSMIFENESEFFLTNADIISISFSNREFKDDVDYYSIDGIRKFFLFGSKNLKKNETREFVINLSGKIPKDKIISLYFNIFSYHNRNKIEDYDKFIPMGIIKWEYWGISNNDKSPKWNEYDFVKDGTYSFLFSGIVNLMHQGKMCEKNGFFKIKISLKYSDYDFMPKINDIRLNVIEVFQKDTKCESVFIKKMNINSNHEVFSFKVKTHLSIYGEKILYVKHKGSWKNIDNFRSNVDFNNSFCEISCDKFDLSEYSDADDVFLLVSYSNEIKDNMIIGSSKGFSNLSFESNFNKLSVYDEFKIMVGRKSDGEYLFDIWERKDDFFSSSKFDNHFVYEENVKLIAFGNNHHGAVPPCGEDNIRFCSLSFTDAESSNIREKMISDVETQNKYLKNSNIVQIIKSTGGRDDESLEHASYKLSEIFNSMHCAVNINDYISIVKKTPGLIIKNVAVFVSNDQVNISVQIPELNSIPYSYKRNLVRWIENFRLINTQVKIVSLKKVNLDININAIVKPDHDGSEEIIKSVILDFIRMLNEKMGQELSRVSLIKKIEDLEFVEKVEYAEIDSPENCEKNLNNIIVIPPNGVYNIKNLDVSCIPNIEIV